MRKFSSLAILLAALALPLAAEATEPVFVRGTIDGAFIRLAATSPGDVTVEMPDPRRFIITVENSDFASGARWPRAEFIEHVQVFGPELMGQGASRVVLRVTVSNMTWRLEQELSDTLVVLEGATPLRQQWIDARAERAAERAERRRAREDETLAEESARRAATAERTERETATERRPRSDAETETLRAELAATQARLRALEEQVSGSGATEAPAERPRTARTPRGRNETARLEPAASTMLPPSPPSTPVSNAAPARVERTSDGMVRIPAGRFTMGTPMGYGFEDEVPAHSVQLAAFEIDEREVTVGDFQRSPVPLPRQPDWNWDSDRPVLNVTWGEAAQYCEWQGKRLPTEAQWEMAARGPESLTYPWGNQWSATRANSGLDGDGHDKTAPVGSFALGASPFGALDMAGNAWEWTRDWYDENYYANSPTSDPQGPTRGTYRVVRGGSFEGQSAMNVRAAIRMPLKASARRENVGFRCSR